MRRLLAFSIILAGGIAAHPAGGQQAQSRDGAAGWTISDAQSASSTTILEFSTGNGKFQWRKVAEDESILQVVAVVESSDRVVGPIRFSDISLANRPGLTDARTIPLLTVGTWNDGCRYLNGRELPENRHVTITMGSGDLITIARAEGNQLQFSAAALRMQVCLAFTVPQSLATGEWVLRAGKHAIPVAHGISSAPGTAAADAQRTTGQTRPPETGSRPQSGDDAGAPLAVPWHLIGAVTLSLAILATIIRLRRTPAAEDAAGAPLEQPLTSPAEQALPPLTASDLPDTYATPGDDPGPGAAMLSAASRAMQHGDFTQAQDCLHQAIALGLEPGHQCWAHLLLGETAINRGDLPAAVREYRQCLCGGQPTLRATLPAATNLALIYRKLGMRDSATVAEHVIASVPAGGETLHPDRIGQISRLASALRRSMRASRLRALLRLSPQFSGRPADDRPRQA